MRVNPGICLYLLEERLSNETDVKIICNEREFKKYAFACAAAPEPNRLNCDDIASRLYDFVREIE